MSDRKHIAVVGATARSHVARTAGGVADIVAAALTARSSSRSSSCGVVWVVIERLLVVGAAGQQQSTTPHVRLARSLHDRPSR